MSLYTVGGDIYIKVGPCGGDKGEAWEDGLFPHVQRIHITHGTSINSIQFEYGLKGSSTVVSDQHGGSGDEFGIGSNICIKVGPCGGYEGEEWDDGLLSRVQRIYISHGTSINSIQTEYSIKDSSTVLSDRHGGSGDKFDVINVSGNLTFIAGYYGTPPDQNGPNVIRSIKFGTDKKLLYGPYGSEEGTPYRFKFNNNFVGFHGLSSDKYLNAIGVHVKTSSRKLLLNQTPSKAITEGK